MSGFIFQCFYDIVRHIPAGTVATYGQVARLAGMPRCARTVGYAMAANRDPSVPCHRVVDRFGPRTELPHYDMPQHFYTPLFLLYAAMPRPSSSMARRRYSQLWT